MFGLMKAWRACRLEAGVAGFRYLDSETVSLENVDEAEALRNTLDAMSIVGLSQQEQVGHPVATKLYSRFTHPSRLPIAHMHLW